MTTTLSIRFPLGRVHATPWDRNVNEASVEWPPSPWRILRALYATWQDRAPQLPQADVHRLLAALAEPPSYLVPASREGSSRHYLPDVGYSTDLVVDAFLAVPRDEDVLVMWGAELEEGPRSALETLAPLLPSLGRADSICEARVLDTKPSVEHGWVTPAGEQDVDAQLRLLCPTLPLDLPALLATTGEMRKARHLRPQGSVWRRYRWPADGPAPAAPAASVVTRRPTVVTWAMATSSRPSITAVTAMTHVLRQAVQSHYGTRHSGAASEVLAGKDAEGRPLRGHLHAHYLALDEDDDKLLDTLAVWAPSGLAPEEVAALVALDHLWGREFLADFRPCNLVLQAVGGVEALPGRLVGPSRHWVSVTPYVAARHRKRREVAEAFLRADVAREIGHRSSTWSSHDLVEPEAVDELAVLPLHPMEYRRHRVQAGGAGALPAAGIQVRFPQPIHGPLSLGHLSHFGLGLFQAR